MHLTPAAFTPTPGHDEFAAEFAAFAAALRGRACPPVVADAVRTNLLDTLACATAGTDGAGGCRSGGARHGMGRRAAGV